MSAGISKYMRPAPRLALGRGVGCYETHSLHNGDAFLTAKNGACTSISTTRIKEELIHGETLSFQPISGDFKVEEAVELFAATVFFVR